ncbi:GNAT family N-acetyltransferase [Streptomyces sp. NPDC059906]|uniref:GNAT family N-acetyltransferase n=1 Tax=Streptomyces sp. NPDC059906 TaxID=3346997 RepID=UPI003650F151
MGNQVPTERDGLGQVGVVVSPLMRTTEIRELEVRLAERDDLAVLPDLQLAAGEAFRDIGMTDIADNPPQSVEELAVYQRAGRAWVGVDATDVPVGFVIVDLLDGCAHIEQVSVHPALRGQGLGRRLIDHAAAWAADMQLPALTLSTFRTVPWNAPYYRRLGFRDVEVGQLTPGLRSVLKAEADFGLDLSARVCMRRPVS